MSFMFMALEIPDADPAVDDPDEIADDIAASLNVSRAKGNRINVGLIPSPQWLTPETLANLRVNASTPERPSPHPLAIDLAEIVDGLPAAFRRDLAHAVVCAPCRQGLVNLIQSSPGYPDLYARQEPV